MAPIYLQVRLWPAWKLSCRVASRHTNLVPPCPPSPARRQETLHYAISCHPAFHTDIERAIAETCAETDKDFLAE